MKKKNLLWIAVLSALPVIANAASVCDPRAEFNLTTCANDYLAPVDKQDFSKANEKNIGKDEKPREKPWGRWTFRSDIDPMTDENIYTAALALSFYQFDKRLVVRCKDKKTEMYIDWAWFLGDGIAKTTVAHRVDKLPVETSEWLVATNKQSTFHPNPVPLLKKIVKSDLFRVQTAPYLNNQVTYEFATKGADVALSDIRKACNW